MGRQSEQTKVLLLLKIFRASKFPFMITIKGVNLLRDILRKKQNLREDE